MRIKAAVVDSVDAPFTYEEIELAEPGPEEVLVRVVASGVCHTDANTRAGDMPLPLPGVLGHEGSGVVERIGAQVTHVAVGDRVIMGWPFCGECRNCLEGEHRYCAKLGPALVGGRRFMGVLEGTTAYARTDGTELSGHFFGQSSFATYSITNQSALVKVDADVPLELVGVLACGITTGAGAVFLTANPSPGDTLVIYGAGAVGLAAVMAAVNTPAGKIVVVDLHDSRLGLARELGATHTINARTEPDVLARVREICGGPADYALECTGVISVVEQAIESVGMLGTCVLIGGAPAEARFSVDHFGALWGRRIIGTLGGSGRSQHLIPALIELHTQGRFPFDRLVQYFDFGEIEEALAASKSGEVIKPILRISDI